MNVSTGGLLLLLIGGALLSAFLTDNLDRWLAALFKTPAPAASASPTGMPTVGSSTSRSTA